MVVSSKVSTAQNFYTVGLLIYQAMNFRVLVDGGATVNLIPKDSLSLKLTPDPRVSIRLATGNWECLLGSAWTIA